METRTKSYSKPTLLITEFLDDSILTTSMELFDNTGVDKAWSGEIWG